MDSPQARLRAFVELSADWCWELDEQFRFTWHSPTRSQDSGIPPEQTLGRTRWEIADAAPDDPFWSAHRAMLERHGVSLDQVELINVNFSLSPSLISGSSHS